MPKLHKELVNLLLTASNAEKEEIGNQIVIALGGDPTKEASGLPKRRGNSDGGIDGRIPVKMSVVNKVERVVDGGVSRPLYMDEIREVITNAAFCIKIENSNFNRDQFGAFLNDMGRERIYNGIIISAKPLSEDALCEFNRINNEGTFRIVHLLIEDILAGNINCNLEFVSERSLSQILYEKMERYNRI